MSFSYLALTLVLLSATPSAAFSGPTAILPRHSMFNRAAVSLRRPALHTLKCQESGQATAEDTASYEIIPSALAEQGGGWSIKGLKAQQQGTVWARARPKVGEVLKMGQGSFGTIYIGYDLLTNEEVAVKTEPDYDLKGSMLRHEGEMLVQLQGCPGIPDVHWIGGRELAGVDSNIMVMDLLGPDMEHLLEFLNKRTFTAKTGLMIARQMIECIESIHARGILHRDIKPENFLMGVGKNANKLYLVDFGLADWYVNENSEHVEQHKTSGDMRGTIRYASINKHNALSESRRDDLEEVMHVILYLICGPLPWQSSELGTIDGLADTKSGKSRIRQIELIKKTKMDASGQELAGRGDAAMPESVRQLLAELMEYARSLEYYDEPDYAWIKGRIDETMQQEGYSMDNEYDWGNKAPTKSGLFGKLFGGK